jgi:hypothetical protein
LGPTFAALHGPDAPDDRPRLYQPPSKTCALSFFNRSSPYELGDEGCIEDDDY